MCNIAASQRNVKKWKEWEEKFEEKTIGPGGDGLESANGVHAADEQRAESKSSIERRNVKKRPLCRILPQDWQVISQLFRATRKTQPRQLVGRQGDMRICWRHEATHVQPLFVLWEQPSTRTRPP
ncbi:hypothetical protein V3C99_009166 [Haemonchus contortus]